MIHALLTGCRPHDLWVGPGDDAAVLPGGLTLTSDTLVQGVHFDDRLTAADLGYKAVAVSVEKGRCHLVDRELACWMEVIPFDFLM